MQGALVQRGRGTVSLAALQVTSWKEPFPGLDPSPADCSQPGVGSRLTSLGLPRGKCIHL